MVLIEKRQMVSFKVRPRFGTRIAPNDWITSKPYFTPGKSHPHYRPLRVGFVALSDCAPLLIAQTHGYFAARRIEVELRREIGWATIRDKIIYGELEAALAPAGLIVAANCGFASVQANCLTALIINLNGNGITLSRNLWERGIRDGDSLRQVIRDRGERPTLAVVHPYSSHHFLLRKWLTMHGISPTRDVNTVVIPPAQVATHLAAGRIDGYCVGEPWNSVAVLAKTGWCVSTSLELAPWHPEKVLMVSRKFAEGAELAHSALISALVEACKFCDQSTNRDQVISLLSRPKYVGVPEATLRHGMTLPFDFGNGRIESIPDLHTFHRHDANIPTAEKGSWVINSLTSSKIIPDKSVIPPNAIESWFRADIYHAALAHFQTNVAA
jgi:ABC-type nitrate/sulfonate/bicarbonate transport system substrate-binding protein